MGGRGSGRYKIRPGDRAKFSDIYIPVLAITFPYFDHLRSIFSPSAPPCLCLLHYYTLLYLVRRVYSREGRALIQR